MLSTLIVNNTSNSTISIHVERIVRNLPPNWTSCFCYPWCVAPFIDTLTFPIAPFSSDSIKPNYHTDPSIPGIGYVTITLYQVGFPNNIDTVAFSGSTLLASGIEEPLTTTIDIYPNPVTENLIVSNPSNTSCILRIYNAAGEMITEKGISDKKSVLGLRQLPEGYYTIQIHFKSGQIISKKIFKTQ